MVYDAGAAYTFTNRAIDDKAPSASGVYTIYSAQRWMYVGESDDIRQSLFRHLNEPGPCMARGGPLSFSFEMAPAAARVPRQQALVAELMPACNTAAG